MPILTPPPTTSIPDPTGDYARAQSWALVTSKYADAGNWATWAANMLNSDIMNISNLLGSDTVNADLAAMVAELGTLTNSNPGTISGGTGTFSDSTLTALKARLDADIAAYSTGLGATVETAMFNRETARINATRAAAYTEITTQFSSRGFDMPTGALLAKQTEMNNETSLRLTDSSGKILEESARLALDYNKHILTVSEQLVDALAKVFESKEVRAFEASKASVMLAVENYKSYLGLYSAKAEISLKKAQIVLDNKARQLALEVSTLQGLAQSAQQIVASALNGVSSSASFGWGASASTSYAGA
jgi:hypothetical protein